MVNKIMADISLLKECGIDSWVLRDESIFPEYEFKVRQEYKFICKHALEQECDIVVLLGQDINNDRLLSNFCQAMFGLDSAFLFLYQSANGNDIDSFLEQSKANKIISFVDFQKDTLNSDHNVLIFNDIDFKLLGSSKKYKKQVMLDVNRVSVSSIRN